MKCVICEKDSGKGYTCSSTCRSRLRRRESKFRQSVANATVSKCDAPGYATVEGKVYGRQAVEYDISEAWSTRPEPLSPDDRPKAKNRGKYVRPDGSEYLFDACGTVHTTGGKP